MSHDHRRRRRCGRAGPAKIDLQQLCRVRRTRSRRALKLLRERHSTRDFDDQQPITLAELSRFLDSAARIQSKWEKQARLWRRQRPDDRLHHAALPVRRQQLRARALSDGRQLQGLERGFYHYDADRHALVPIAVRPQEIDAQLESAEFAMDAPNAPQILITIAARFDRISWKYSSIAYSLVLKNVGVMMQTLYLMATGHGSRRMRDRQQQYRSVREDDRRLNSTSRGRLVSLRWDVPGSSRNRDRAPWKSLKTTAAEAELPQLRDWPSQQSCWSPGCGLRTN